MRPLSCWLHTASPQSNHPARIWQQKQDQTQKSWSDFRLWNYLIPDLTFAKTKRVILRNISVLQLEVHSSTQNFDRKKALFKIKSIANSRMFFRSWCHYFMIIESISNMVLQSNPNHLKLWTAFLLISRNWFVPGTNRIHTLPRLNGRYGTVGDQ